MTLRRQNFATGFTAAELDALYEICKRQELTPAQVLRQALRTYQLLVMAMPAADDEVEKAARGIWESICCDYPSLGGQIAPRDVVPAIVSGIRRHLPALEKEKHEKAT